MQHCLGQCLVLQMLMPHVMTSDNQRPLACGNCPHRPSTPPTLPANEHLTYLLHSAQAADPFAGIRLNKTRIIRWLLRRSSTPRSTAPIHHPDERQLDETPGWLHASGVRTTGKLHFSECAGIQTPSKLLLAARVGSGSSGHALRNTPWLRVPTAIILIALRATAGHRSRLPRCTTWPYKSLVMASLTY